MAFCGDGDKSARTSQGLQGAMPNFSNSVIGRKANSRKSSTTATTELPSMAVNSWRRMSLNLCLKNDGDTTQINDSQPLAEATSAAAALGAVSMPFLSSNIIKSVGLESPRNGAGQNVDPEQQISLTEESRSNNFGPLPLNSQTEDGSNYRLSLLSGHTSRSDMMMVTYHNVSLSANQHRTPNPDNSTLKNGHEQEFSETSYTPVGVGVDVNFPTSPIALNDAARVDAGNATMADETLTVRQVCDASKEHGVGRGAS